MCHRGATICERSAISLLPHRGDRLAEDIGDLEGYVRATSVMLFFLSKKYFQSRNCLREIRASLEQEKP